MSSITATLRECHRLRRHIRTLQEEIDRGPRVLKAREARLEAERQAHKDHHDLITRLKLKQRDAEGSLKQTEARLDKLKELVNTAANQKEYDARQAEIGQATKNKGEFEDLILQTMTELEEAVAKTAAVDKHWADVQAEYAQDQAAARDRLGRMTADQAAAREELAARDAEIPPAVKPKYDTLVKAHGPDAFAAVKDRVCQGCRTTLTAQREVEMRAGGFYLCPTCGKMLYPAE